MPLSSSSSDALTVSARNVGGIDRTDVSLSSGVTVLTGRNATNRTSFLQALMAALGSEQPSLKGDAEEGRVELEIGDNTYHRTLQRTDAGVVFDGDPYLEDPDVADRFAFLLGDNEARLAVERDDDLRDVIMQPIDTAEIEAEIDRLETEKRELRDELDRLASLADELPELEAKKRRIEDDLEAKREELATLQDEREEEDVDVEEHRARKEQLEALFDDLRDEQSTLETVEFDLETERASLEELEAERDQLEATLDEMDVEEEAATDLKARIESLRARKQTLDSTLNELQSVISFNEEAIEYGGPDVGEAVESDGTGTGPDEGGAITDTLVEESDEVVCWTCGSDVTTDRIEETIEQLRSFRATLVEDRNELQEQIGSLTERRDSIAERKRERERTERRLASIEDDITTTRERIESLEVDREAAAEAVEDLEDDVAAFEDTDHDEVLETHREINRLELEIERLESDREKTIDRIGEVEQEIDRREELQTDREHLQEQLTELRTRVDRIEADAVESFNEHMELILDVLEYANIERVWIERRQREARDGRRTVSETVFDLHVVRVAEDGTTYRDTVDHLSESEREVTGLVFALAGYLVHDLSEDLPIMLLDSLEAIDADRIAELIEYFEDHADYLVVVLLPEDAAAVSEEYEYVTEI